MTDEQNKILIQVLTAYQSDEADIDYRKQKDNGKMMLLVADSSDIAKIDSMLGQALLDAGEISSREFEEGENYESAFLDLLGVEYGYRDDYFVCDGCFKIVPFDGLLGPTMEVVDGDYYCKDCIKEDKAWYIKKILEQKDPELRCVRILDAGELEKLGFTKVDDFDLSGGATADYERAKEQFPDKQIIFRVADDPELWICD